MNTTVCNVTNKSPYCLVFGQEPWADSQLADALHNSIDNDSEFDPNDILGGFDPNDTIDNDGGFDSGDTIGNDGGLDSGDTIGNDGKFGNNSVNNDEFDKNNVNDNDDSDFISHLSHHYHYTDHTKDEQSDFDNSPSYYNNSISDNNEFDEAANDKPDHDASFVIDDDKAADDNETMEELAHNWEPYDPEMWEKASTINQTHPNYIEDYLAASSSQLTVYYQNLKLLSSYMTSKN